MSLKKAAGLDVNGWLDHVARNWSIDLSGDEQIGDVLVGQAGPLTAVVKTGDGKWIGGKPADLAPHGRGGGWGQVGAADRRVFVRDLIEGKTDSAQKLASAFTELARGATNTVLAIEDSGETTEQVQERLLAAMSIARLRNPALVWRTVLSTLFAIAEGLIKAECVVGVISHASCGLSVQKFRIRLEGEKGDVLAPERRSAAKIHAEALGLRQLFSRVREEALSSQRASLETSGVANSKTLVRLAFGLPYQPEIIRRDNGDWEEVKLDAMDALPAGGIEAASLGLQDCDQIFLETISEGNVRSHLERSLKAAGISVTRTLPSDAVARGALVAAQRMGDGDPVYFDFLPRISTIVSGSEGARNFDLVDETETLEAGRVYRSPEPAQLAIPKGYTATPVYLRKEAELHPRKATIQLAEPLAEATPVSLWVEQKPAAGRARIVMEAPSLGRHFTIDWDQADEDPRAWDDIINSLTAPPPSIPERLVLKCGMMPWNDAPNSPGMLSLLEEIEAESIDWRQMAVKASSRPGGEYCVSSDGDLPSELSPAVVKQLDKLVRQAFRETEKRLRAGSRHAEQDNAALQFLTWQFRRTPDEVAQWLLECIENHSGAIGTHPFVWHQANWVLVYQGIARTVNDQATEERILASILKRGIESWNYRAESACVSLLLSRSQTAPRLLSRSDVDKIAERAIFEFRREYETQYTRFNYAPFLIGGLLRWRLKEPWALLVGQDPVADRLAQVIIDARADILNRWGADDAFERRQQKYLPILDDLLAYLTGEGGNPNLLLAIYEA